MSAAVKPQTKAEGKTKLSIIASMKQKLVSALSERVAAALTSPETPSETLAALHEEVAQAQKQANAQAKQAEERALDPTLSTVDADNAEAAAQSAAFAARRLEVALTRLAEYRDSRAKEEQQAELWAAYRAVEKRRDAVAQLISDEYPQLARKMVALIRAALDTSIEVDAVNRRLPDDAPMLDGPDGAARGFKDNGREGTKGLMFGPLHLACAVIPDPDNVEKALWPHWGRSDGLRRDRGASYEEVRSRYRDPAYR